MSFYIVEYDPAISGEAHKVIENNVTPEMENQETSIYEIVNCIKILEEYGHLQSDLDYLMDLAEDDINPRSYIEF